MSPDPRPIDSRLLNPRTLNRPNAFPSQITQSVADRGDTAVAALRLADWPLDAWRRGRAGRAVRARCSQPAAGTCRKMAAPGPLPVGQDGRLEGGGLAHA